MQPSESESKKSTESSTSHRGWWAAKCSTIPLLSVRDRHGSPEDPNRPVMTVADTYKKRKRVLSPARTSTQSEEPAQQEKPMSPSFLRRSKKTEKAAVPKTDEAENESKPEKHMEEPNTIREVFDFVLNDSTTIERYSKVRAELLRLEAEDAWDRGARPTSNSDVAQRERRAADVILAIREFERVHVFGNQASEALPGLDTLEMGGQYLTNKHHIDHVSLLYRIAHKLPKGGLLHLHFNAEIAPELLLVKARDVPQMHVWSLYPILSAEDLLRTEIQFTVPDPNVLEYEADIFSSKYIGGSKSVKPHDNNYPKVWMRWDNFRATFKKRFPGMYEQTKPSTPPSCCSQQTPVELDAPENWIKSKMQLSEAEAYGPTQTVNGVWARFNQATRCFKGLINYRSVYKWYIGHAIDRMIEENVMYAELRPMLLDKSIPENNGVGVLNNAEQMQLIIDGVLEKQAELKKKGEEDRFPFGLKIIYCTPRSIPPFLMWEEMKQCMELHQKFPKLICGFDLVGAEDRKNPINEYAKELNAFKRTCEKFNFNIPFLFHAGETLLDTGGTTDPQNSNLYEAVALGSKRIGHGFALMKHPQLVEIFKKKDNYPGICVELCPISNELLHLCRNIKEHPYPELLAAGIPCTVNSDNPSLFSNSMSHEFYQIMVGAPSMSLYSWKQLARWSLDYSCLDKDQIAQGHKILNREWDKFCKHVIKEYEPMMSGDKVDIQKVRKLEKYSKLHEIAA